MKAKTRFVIVIFFITSVATHTKAWHVPLSVWAQGHTSSVTQGELAMCYIILTVLQIDSLAQFGARVGTYPRESMVQHAQQMDVFASSA